MAVTQYTADNLVIENPITDNRLVVASGQGELTRGTLLTLNSGKLEKCLTTKTPHSILVEDVDATSTDAVCSYYVGGVFNENSINYNDGSADEFREALRSVGIITKGAN